MKKYLHKFFQVLFPPKCINCKKEGAFLCKDCFSLIDINPFEYCMCNIATKNPKCKKCRNEYVDQVFSAAYHKQWMIKKILKRYSYSKELSDPLALIIISHLELIEKNLDKNASIDFVEEEEKEIRKRGFDRNKELAEALSRETEIKIGKGKEKIYLVSLIFPDKNIFKKAKALKDKGTKKVFVLTVARKIDLSLNGRKKLNGQGLS